MIIRSAILWSSLAILAGTGVLLMKNEVETEERHLLHIKKSIVATEQSLHVLRAEWSYLNDPLRLRLQAEKHLGLKPMRANQIMTLEQIPRLGDSPSINNFSDPESGNIPQNTITKPARKTHKDQPNPPSIILRPLKFAPKETAGLDHANPHETPPQSKKSHELADTEMRP